MVDFFKKKEEKEDASEEFKRGIFYSGLALTNQHTSVLFILPIALLVLLKTKFSIAVLKTAIVTVAIPLSLYLYLPLSAYFSNAKWTWGDSTSIDGILTHVLRAEYGTFSLASGHAGRGLEVMMTFNARQFIDDFTIFGFVLGIFGIILALNKPAWRLIVIFAFYTWFFNWRCNLDPEQVLFKGVIQRFYLQSGIIFCIFIGIAAEFALKLIEKKMQRRVLPVFILSVPVLVAGYRYEAMNYSRFTHVSDFADHLANSFPENSIILMKGDLPSNSLRFVDVVEKRRPDCSFIDTQPMTYPWYIKMLGHHFPGIHFPGKRYHLQGKSGDFSLAEFIYKNPERNIFGCIGLQELEKIAKDGIWSMPWGVCEQFFVSRNFSSENWNIEKQESYSSAQLALSNWSHEPSEASNLPDHSWEKVANDEIYAAIVKSAMWSFDAAEEAKKEGKKDEAKQFYAWSYAFYKNAIEKMGEKSPSYWYKNAALIHPTAAQFLGKIENTGSYEETYEMFKTYLSQNEKLGIATDDEEAVKKAIDDIGKFLGK